MSDAAINKALAVSEAWRPEPRYQCVACGSAARLHPETSHIWGCLRCGFTTAAVSHYFIPADVIGEIHWG